VNISHQALEDLRSSMFNPDYEKRLLLLFNANRTTIGPSEARPFSAALPLSGGLPRSSNDMSPIMAKPEKRPVPQSPRHINSGDRFIPTRAGNNCENKSAMITENGCNGLTTKKAGEDDEGSRSGSVYSCLLKNELLGASIQDVKGQCDERTNLFQYQLSNGTGNGFGGDPSSLAFLCHHLVQKARSCLDLKEKHHGKYHKHRSRCWMPLSLKMISTSILLTGLHRMQ
jgi:hypothetical protein